MSAINAQGIPIPILERTLGMPLEGPKCVPIPLDFTAGTIYTLDLSNQVWRGRIAMVQTMYVDNLDSAAVLTVRVSSPVNQRITIPAGAQGYFPIICPNPSQLTFTSTGGVAVQVILLNFPVFA